jgi:hypothetical protein
MLYKFKSRATADVIMLEPNGRQLVQIMGKEPGTSGIVTAQQIPGAIAAIEAAVRRRVRGPNLMGLRATKRPAMLRWKPFRCASVLRRCSTCCAAVRPKAVRWSGKRSRLGLSGYVRSALCKP